MQRTLTRGLRRKYEVGQDFVNLCILASLATLSLKISAVDQSHNPSFADYLDNLLQAIPGLQCHRCLEIKC